MSYLATLSRTRQTRRLRPAHLAAAALLAALAGCSVQPQAHEPTALVLRHRIAGSDFPIAAAVEVPPGATMVYLSGTVPPADSLQPPAGVAGQGSDTRTQTLGALRSIEQQLKGLGLGMGNIVKMQVFLVADPKRGNTMDFAGFMEAYTQHFGTATQPNLPVRSVFQVAGLVNPAWRVEIEVTAVRMPGMPCMPALAR